MILCKKFQLQNLVSDKFILYKAAPRFLYNSGRLPNIHDIVNSLVQQSDYRIACNEKPDRSMEDQSDNWYRDTARVDRGKFFRQALHRIASSGT